MGTGADVRSTEPSVPFVASGSYPVRAGSAVRPLVDGEPAFRRICEAVERARHSVWVTVAFLLPDFRMPDDRGSFFDVLDRAVARGLDVRVLFWRVNPETNRFEPRVFSGSRAQLELLGARGCAFHARWDRAHGGYCQHQKSWLVDAGQASEVAFVGGINLNPRAVVSPGHAGRGHIHDVYAEVAGPAATDVHHNFVQRWNEASERAAPDGVWGPGGGGGDLPFPTLPSSPAGASLAQIQRTVHAGRYRDGPPTPGGRPFAIADGERSILEQYLRAIRAARRSIYIENQAFEVPEVVAELELALERGVDAVILVPSEPENRVRAARRRPDMRAFDDLMRSLGRHERFALVGIAGRSEGGRHDVYVHAKVMLIDDAWATIGSCNLHASSVLGNTELNATFWDPGVVRALRRELLAEHLGLDTADLDDRAALDAYRLIARENRARRDAGDPEWQGLAFGLDPATYGR